MADEQSEIIRFLLSSEAYPHPVSPIRHIETHISHVFLTGDFAYKLKKAVKFDFLDFSTAAARLQYCQQEIRLNSRFSPDIYLDVVAVCRTAGGLRLGQDGTPQDYLVKMRQFDIDSTFDSLAAAGRLETGLLIEAADAIARFHLTAELQSGYWGPKSVEQAIEGNFSVCSRFTPTPIDPDRLSGLISCSRAELSRLAGLISQRQSGHVRALHGDLHLRNICCFQGRVQLFDGIEFNPQLSNCDVWADFAFFVMDLLSHGRDQDASRVVNRYLLHTDDYSGLRLLNLYTSYRAAVRAKVNCLALASGESAEEHTKEAADAARYVMLAGDLLKKRRSAVIAIGGFSGSGKSSLAAEMAARLRAVHIPSDAVRKHLCGIAPFSPGGAAAYEPEVSRRTYQGLIDRIGYAAETGRPVILDAVYHSQAERAAVEAAAAEFKLPFAGVWCDVSLAAALTRIYSRGRDISDADQAVAELQRGYDIGEIGWQRIDTTERSPQEVVSQAMAIAAGFCRPD